MMGVQKQKNQRTILMMFIVLVSFYTTGIGKTIYVDNDATSTNTSSSWADAYWCLQDALADARNGDEILVAQGTYKPDQQVVTTARSRAQLTSSGDRTATFQLKNGVSIKGGYAGFGETDPDARDTNLYVTILSGDLNGDDKQNFVNNSENSYHVVTSSGTNASSVLEGVTVTRGNANGLYPHNSGGGVYNEGGSPRLTACVFTDNSGQNGGGMYNSNGSPVLNNCIFSGNSVSNMGGGMFIYEGQGERRPMLTNCIFSNNSALSGGGILSGKRGNAILTNCTFTENHNEGIQCDDSSVTITNSILWNNNPNEIGSSQGFVTVTYSNIQGGWSGIGNINTNPMFVNASEGDYRLQPDSPCIDAGKNSAIPESVLTDLDGNSRIINNTVDIGAYENIPIPNVYHIDVVNGNDNNDGLTPETALVTIQKGIDTAVDGELVLVYPGLYKEEINFKGKKLTVQGVVISPVGAPVLQNPGDIAVSFYSEEGPDSILRNFIISDSFMGVFIAGSSPTISNLTIVDNRYGIEAYAGSEPDISNSILWNNTNGDLFGCEARYSCIERGSEGEGNISSDPLFVEIDSGDYHLRSERGRYWREHDVWILDKVTSSCIDGGDPNSDPSDEPVPNGGRINMGAYGGTLEASLSLNEQPCPVLLGKAFNPNPADGFIGVKADVILSWTAGMNAVMHDVYFGTNPILGNVDLISALQMDTSYQFTGSLAPSTTYYWRVDEFDGVSTQKGDVWSFTTADIEEGIKGEYYKGLDFENLVLTRIDPQINFNWGSSGPDPTVGPDKFSVRWTGDVAATFTETYTFYTNSDGGLRLWVDSQRLINRWWYDPSVSTELTGSIDLVGGQTYSFLMEYQARRSNGMVELYWESPHTAKQLVPQASFSLPLKARYPNPANGAIEVKFTPVLTWDRGDYAASHNVYFGTNEQAVRNATMNSPEYKGSVAAGNESYDPGMLDWYTTYYWRIDEVNQVNPDSPWKGNVWSFTTVDFIVVDDFESYNELDIDVECTRIFCAWIDGYDDPNNGSIVGYFDAPFTEQTIVHSGRQSMPFSYDNTVGKSEATLTLTDTRDWTEEGVGVLSLWFIGTAANDPEIMYVVLNGTAGVDNDNPNAAQVDSWTEWRIDLQEFADQGVNLANVNTITIGFGNRSNPVASGSGMMYFDDIRLYRPSQPYWPYNPTPVSPEPPPF